MVSPEMRASALEAIEEERRREWRASRTPFQRRGESGTINATAAGVLTQLAASTSADIERIKRLQIKLMLPKGGYIGFVGVIRVAMGMAAAIPQLGFGDPALLRPIYFLANPDHATYWDYFLPAINLADGGDLHIFTKTEQGGTAVMDFTARWVHERGLEG